MKRPEPRRRGSLGGPGAVHAASALLMLSACGSDGETPRLGDGRPTRISAAANSDEFLSPFDATPDAEGKLVYFTALTRDGEPGIFKVASAGGPITRLHVGPPLATPFGIAMSADGKNVVIADTDAAHGDEEEGTGALFVLSVDGGTPSALGGGSVERPRGVEIAGGDVYFTSGAAGSKAGLYKITLSAGAAVPVAIGAPFADPSGVAVRGNGEIYVADSSPIGARGSGIVRVTNGRAEVIDGDLAVGHPAGLALARNDDVLLLSGIDHEKGTDVVYRFDLSSGERSLFDAVIKDFQESAGLHRAKSAEVYAWADSRANHTGTVYVLSN